MSFTRPMDGILDYPEFFVRVGRDQWQVGRVESIKMQGKGLVAKLEGVEDRDAALVLRNCDLAIEKAALPSLKHGEYYWSDLIGLSVRTVEGVELGKIDSMVETGSNDVLVVKGERERLIPYIPDQVVRDIDLDAGRMRVDWDPDF